MLQDTCVLRYIDFRAGKKFNTPLHCAVENKNLAAVRALHFSGASIEARNLRLCTPLHTAIKYRDEAVATYLLTHAGADANAVRVRLEPPLKYAVRNGLEYMVDLLHARGASLNDRNSENKTALHSAAAHETTALVRNLVQKGAEINARSSYGSTPLFLAAQNGRLATGKLLLEHGADPKLGRLGHGNARVRGPKHIAKRGGNLEVVQLLEC
jgi:ankyrin repeat protein